MARDVLSAVPVLAEDTSVQALPRGGVLLVRRLPVKSGLFGGLVRRLHLERELRYELDEVGAWFWAHVDGQRRLSDIQVELCQRFSLEPKVARRAVVEFTASLMRRNLLALRPEDT